MRVNHRNVLEEVSRAYRQEVMTNVHRSAYVEAMVYLALQDCGWRRMEAWDSWDCERDGVGLEVKQSAAAQSWTSQRRSPPRFDIAARKSYWDGNKEVNQPGRHAVIYVFAWHGEPSEAADQRDPNSWEFYVVLESELPDQKSIGLTPLRSLSTPCRIDHLATRVTLVLANR